MKRVLVVEPHPQVREALSDLVEDEPGCELIGAVSTTPEAIPLISDASPDVVLVDADTSTWLFRQLGELLPMALLVLLSAATDPRQERPESPAKTPAIRILKTAVPDFLRSLSA